MLTVSVSLVLKISVESVNFSSSEDLCLCSDSVSQVVKACACGKSISQVAKTCVVVERVSFYSCECSFQC